LRNFLQKENPFDTVGFYDHENFIKEERKDPEFLEIYAAYVNKKKLFGTILDSG
jgi:hypothetical protein